MSMCVCVRACVQESEWERGGERKRGGKQRPESKYDDNFVVRPPNTFSNYLLITRWVFGNARHTRKERKTSISCNDKESQKERERETGNF